MKRKILSLILVLMLLPIASLFSACGKDKSYNLNNLKNDFNTIAEENNNISISGNGSIVFEYNAKLNRVINETSPYNQLPKYNEVFYNIMAFACEYIDECAKNSITDNSEAKNRVNEDLKSLKKSINNVNECVNVFAEIINVSEGVDVTAPTCLLRYEHLLKEYENLFASAIDFSNSLANLYFNNILRDGNPDVYSKGIESFDATIVVNKLRSRLYYQKSSLSQCFVEMYVGGDLAQKVANNETTFDLSKYNYSANISAINKSFEETKAVEVANNSINKSNFYELAVRAQNLQTILKQDHSKFVYACKEVEYPVVKTSETATPNQLMCVSIIESSNALISTYNSVLAQMLNIISSVN